jgi:hypothetical protein
MGIRFQISRMDVCDANGNASGLWTTGGNSLGDVRSARTVDPGGRDSVTVVFCIVGRDDSDDVNQMSFVIRGIVQLICPPMRKAAK